MGINGSDNQEPLVASDPISLLLDELEFQDAMKRSIILGICTRLMNSGERTMADLIMEIKHHGALVFLTTNMGQPSSSSMADEFMSGRGTTSRRRPLPVNFRKSSSASITRPSAEEIAEARRIYDSELAAAQAEKPVDGDTLLDRIRDRLAGALGSDSIGGEGNDRSK